MQVRSFTSSSKIVIKLVLFIAIILGVLKGIGYVTNDDSRIQMRVKFHEFYETEQIEIAYIGASHVYQAFDPEIFDEYTGVNSFNLGTDMQQVDGGYALLKEVGNLHPELKEVYFDLFYYMYPNANPSDRTELTSTYLISDYLKPSINKFTYLLQGSSVDCWINDFSLARRNWKTLLDFEEMKRIIELKQTDSYKNYESVALADGKKVNEARGFISWDAAYENGGIFEQSPQAVYNYAFSNKDVQYIEKIMDYCDNKGIKCTFTSIPVTDFRLVQAHNYDNFIMMVKNIVESHGCEYVDFNLLKEGYFDGRDSYFQDDNHLSVEGAKVFSEVFAKWYKKEITDIFYDSYAEKLENTTMQIYGLIPYEETDAARLEELKDLGTLPEAYRLIYMMSVSNTDKPVEYRFTKVAYNQEVLVQDFDENPYFVFPSWEEGTLIIEARIKGTECKNRIEVPFSVKE